MIKYAPNYAPENEKARKHLVYELFCGERGITYPWSSTPYNKAPCCFRSINAFAFSSLMKACAFHRSKKTKAQFLFRNRALL